MESVISYKISSLCRSCRWMEIITPSKTGNFLPCPILGIENFMGEKFVKSLMLSTHLPSPSCPLLSARTDQHQFRPLVLVVFAPCLPPNFKKHNQCPMLFVLALDCLLASRLSIAFLQCNLKLCLCSLSPELCSCCTLELYTNLSSWSRWLWSAFQIWSVSDEWEFLPLLTIRLDTTEVLNPFSDFFSSGLHRLCPLQLQRGRMWSKKCCKILTQWKEASTTNESYDDFIYT